MSEENEMPKKKGEMVKFRVGKGWSTGELLGPAGEDGYVQIRSRNGFTMTRLESEIERLSESNGQVEPYVIV